MKKWNPIDIFSIMDVQGPPPFISSLVFAYLYSSMQQSKDNPLGVKALKRTAAKPHWAYGGDGKRSSA